MKETRIMTGAVLALLVAVPLILFGESGPSPDRARGAEQAVALLERLRDGGYVLACRHAITDRSRGDSRRVSLDDRSTQRVLSRKGEEQARSLGRELDDLGIPVGQVVAGEYFRNSDTAELAFGRVETDPGLNYGRSPEKRARRRELFSEPPRPGANRVLVTHQGILYRMLPDVKRGSIDEGHCVVVEPLGDGRWKALERVEPGRWAELGAGA